LNARAIEKLLDGPAGYAIAIGAAVIGVLIILEFVKNQGPAVGNSAGGTVGNFITGLGSAIQAPFDNYFAGTSETSQ
jgi:hypothetical protein